MSQKDTRLQLSFAKVVATMPVDLDSDDPELAALLLEFKQRTLELLDQRRLAAFSDPPLGLDLWDLRNLRETSK